MGAGAVGGTVGALLAQTGKDVVLLARGAHAAALRADGLTLARPSGTSTVRIPVVERVQELELGEDDVLLLATKSQDTAGLVADLAGRPVGGAAAGELLPLLLLQNGVDNESEALRRFAHVHGVCVMLPATHLEPGRIEANGAPLPGVLEVGRYPSGVDDVDRAVCADLSAAGFLATVREDVMAWKRAKLLRNVGNALEALAGRDLDEREQAVMDELEAQARAESERCYAAAGLGWVPDAEWVAHRKDRCSAQAVEGRGRQGGSTWQSVSRGAGTVEADHLNGEIVLLGRLHGVPTPVNALLQREVHALARRRGAAGSVPPSVLRERLDRESPAAH